MSQHGAFFQHSSGISRRNGAILIKVLRLQTKKILVYLSHFTQYSSKLFKLGNIDNWRQLMSCWGRFRKKLTNVDQKLGLGEEGLVKGDVHRMKEILKDENTDKQAKY